MHNSWIFKLPLYVYESYRSRQSTLQYDYISMLTVAQSLFTRSQDIKKIYNSTKNYNSNKCKDCLQISGRVGSLVSHPFVTPEVGGSNPGKGENICYGWDGNFMFEDCFALNCTLISLFVYLFLESARTENNNKFCSKLIFIKNSFRRLCLSKGQESTVVWNQ